MYWIFFILLVKEHPLRNCLLFHQ